MGNKITMGCVWPNMCVIQNRSWAIASLLLLLSTLLSCRVAVADLSVVVSVKPLHALVAGVMGEIGDAALIVDGSSSPHAYSLKPSQAKQLQQADVVFWVGPELESFLGKSIHTLASTARVIEILRVPEVSHLTFRQFDRNADNPGGHDQAALDPHVWLDPRNAVQIVHNISQVLSDHDPANKAQYVSNSRNLIALLAELEDNITAQLVAVTNTPFIVFHDAYGYFEYRFGLHAVAAITTNSELQTGAERISRIRRKMQLAASPMCIFSEPQFSPKIIESVSRGVDARRAVLDPLGSALKSGPRLYFNLLQQMADSFENCLRNTGGAGSAGSDHAK